MSVNPTQNRLIHAHCMWRSFRHVTHFHALYRAALAETQSFLPPMTCRREWQPKVYIASRNALSVSTIEPTPTPNFRDVTWPAASVCTKMYEMTASYDSRKMKITARYMNQRWMFWMTSGPFCSPQYVPRGSPTAQLGGSPQNAL